MTFQIIEKRVFKKFEPFSLHIHFEDRSEVAVFIQKYQPSIFAHSTYEDLYYILKKKIHE